MRTRDTTQAMLSLAACMADALAIFGGFMLAVWLRFSSGWFALTEPPPDALYRLYALAAAVGSGVFLLVLRNGGFYVRPQTGKFTDKIPRMIKCGVTGIVLTAMLAFAVQNEIDLSRLVIGLAFFTILFLLLLERWILYRVEWNMARHAPRKSRVLIVGTNTVASHLRRSLEKEPMLRARVCGFIRTGFEAPAQDIPETLIQGSVDELAALIDTGTIDRIILADSSLGHDRIVSVLLMCERNLVEFQMVPDLFRVMTGSMDMQSLDDIPLLGVCKWPLDFFWNRMLKRAFDIAGSLTGVLLSAPLVMVAGVAIRVTSRGPVFYRQERCGENGRCFTLYKLRTMGVDAEADSGPVWACPEDARRTRVGAFLREHNLDELPQFWNVLKGDMSLVGPRPERPHFVERFKEDIGRYMWRHVSRPGMTGWAQVNGLRGDTSLEERVKYDLFYLENWSLSFDFKILMRTFFASRNAY